MRAVTLQDPTAAVTATFVPEAGMIGTSLVDLSDGTSIEFLGQRRGLPAYLESGKTMGIPILYPWANRLSGTMYQTGGGQVVDVRPDADGVRLDANGLPIHGLLAAHPGWHILSEEPHRLAAQFDFTAHPELLASFPFPHVLSLDITLADRTLTIETTVTAGPATAVPLCYGFHPYLQLPGIPRAQWRIDTPSMRHLELDSRGIPTGAGAPQLAASELLGDKSFDDAYDGVPDGAEFSVSGGGRRVTVRFERGYSAAQIFAPVGEDLICFEPMAAPTDALTRGDYPTVAPGTSAQARFAIQV